MGRPRKTADERLNASLPPVRVTTAELAFVEAQAAIADCSISEFVRRRALGRKVAPARTATDERLIVEINRVGVNLNQIAARLNATGESPEGLPEAIGEVRAVMAKVAEHGS